MFLCTDEYIYIYQCRQIISFWLLWLIEYNFKINLSDSLSLLRKYMCYALRYLYRLKSKCYYNFKSMKQLWWKIKMYLFTLLSTWLTPKNSIITLHKFKAYDQLSKSIYKFRGSSGGSVVKNCLPMQEMQETWVQFPGLRRSPGVGNGNPLHDSC